MKGGWAHPQLHANIQQHRQNCNLLLLDIFPARNLQARGDKQDIRKTLQAEGGRKKQIETLRYILHKLQTAKLPPQKWHLRL